MTSCLKYSFFTPSADDIICQRAEGCPNAPLSQFNLPCISGTLLQLRYPGRKLQRQSNSAASGAVCPFVRSMCVCVCTGCPVVGGWMWVSVRSLDCDNDNELVLLSSWPKTLPVSHVSLLCSQQLKLISSGEQFSQKQSVESQLGKLETSLSSHSPTQQHPLPPPFSGWTTTIVC